jgi:hypothetical protein
MNPLPDRLMEAILEDEGLTDGLTDADGQVLLDWTMQRTAALFTSNLPADELESRAHGLRQQARRVGQIVVALPEGESPGSAQRLLSRLWPDPERAAALLSSLREQPTPAAQIRCLLAALEEQA